ncbi:MAG: class I SAM-dependent methyltransferase [Anaerolineales bacterium]|nr:class I SAM-dependent methyltransferase [Anaerolineales bacterium]
MKKDYIPITDNDATLTEIEYIERFWTKVWNERDPIIAHKIQKREEYQVMARYLSALPPNARILDGGCGLGEWTVSLSEKGYAVTGIDISRLTVEKLQEKFPAFHFAIGDLRSTGFEDESFDAYFSWGTFEHFEEGFAAPLSEARRILKKGGTLFISVPFQNGRHLRRGQRPLWTWDENFDKNQGYHSKMRFYQWRITRSELQQELEINGFKTLQVQPIHKLQGLQRAIRHDLKINPRTTIGKILQVFLYPFVPSNYVAHMLIGVGVKL